MERARTRYGAPVSAEEQAQHLADSIRRVNPELATGMEKNNLALNLILKTVKVRGESGGIGPAAAEAEPETPPTA